MSLLTIPEFILHDTLTKLLTWIRADYIAQSDKTKSYIYRLLNGAGFQRYDFFTQAIAVFCGPDDDPRKLTVELMFNMERKGAPSIHITLPAEQTQSGGNGIGVDENYIPDEIIEGDPDTHTPGEDTPIYTRRYQAIYNVVVTSDNSNETILVFHVVKALLTAATFHLHQNDLQNISLGGQDIRPYNELANQLYMRAVSVSLQYDTSVIAIDSLPIPNDLVVTGTPETDEDEETDLEYGEGLGSSNV